MTAGHVIGLRGGEISSRALHYVSVLCEVWRLDGCLCSMMLAMHIATVTEGREQGREGCTMCPLMCVGYF
jgi:hypothetical protein